MAVLRCYIVDLVLFEYGDSYTLFKNSLLFHVGKGFAKSIQMGIKLTKILFKYV